MVIVAALTLGATVKPRLWFVVVLAVASAFAFSKLQPNGPAEPSEGSEQIHSGFQATTLEQSEAEADEAHAIKFYAISRRTRSLGYPTDPPDYYYY